MFVKYLRQKMHLSQEELAERSKLSLRTIQRVEQGHRISFRSLRALASVFSIEVDELEQELYAMNTQSEEHIESPLWVRILLSHCWGATNKSALLRVEKGLVLAGCLCLIVSAIIPVRYLFDTDISNRQILLLIAPLHFVSAYAISVVVRIGDSYKAWDHEKKETRYLFGLLKH